MPVKYLAPSKIEGIATDILNDFPDAITLNEEKEIDIYKVAEGLGCEVVEVDFTPKNVVAQVQRNKLTKEHKYVIQVARQDSARRKKFSVAHEISHIILHDDGKSNFVERRQALVEYMPNELYKEVQANMLAAALLMPKEQIIKLWKATKSIDEIADILNVSKDAVTNRLSNLGLLVNE